MQLPMRLLFARLFVSKEKGEVSKSPLPVNLVLYKYQVGRRCDLRLWKPLLLPVGKKMENYLEDLYRLDL